MRNVRSLLNRWVVLAVVGLLAIFLWGCPKGEPEPSSSTPAATEQPAQAEHPASTEETEQPAEAEHPEGSEHSSGGEHPNSEHPQ